MSAWGVFTIIHLAQHFTLTLSLICVTIQVVYPSQILEAVGNMKKWLSLFSAFALMVVLCIGTGLPLPVSAGKIEAQTPMMVVDLSKHADDVNYDALIKRLCSSTDGRSITVSFNYYYDAPVGTDGVWVNYWLNGGAGTNQKCAHLNVIGQIASYSQTIAAADTGSTNFFLIGSYDVSKWSLSNRPAKLYIWNFTATLGDSTENIAADDAYTYASSAGTNHQRNGWMASKGTAFPDEMKGYLSFITYAEHPFHNFVKDPIARALKTPATANAPAEYYLSCTCGAMSGDTFTTDELEYEHEVETKDTLALERAGVFNGLLDNNGVDTTALRYYFDLSLRSDGTTETIAVGGNTYIVKDIRAMLVANSTLAELGRDDVTADMIDNTRVLDVDIVKFRSERYDAVAGVKTYSFSVLLTNIKSANVGKAVTSRAYLVCEDANGNTVYVYGNSQYTSVKEMYYVVIDSNGGANPFEKKLKSWMSVALTSNSADRYNPQNGGADGVASAMRDSITNASDKIQISGKKYYVSSLRGNDANDGLSEATPVRTLSGISKKYSNINAGDAILFERGGIYRGQLTLKSGVTYAAYGRGAKPQIYGSKMNYTGNGMWTKTQWENVWLLSERISNDLGTIVFDDGEAVGIRKTAGASELKKNFHYYYDSENKQVYLYLDKNPSEAFEDIEMCESGNLLQAPKDSSNITIDNLTVKYTGSHGIHFPGGNRNIKITNCEIGWIGGSYLTGTTRFGNAIEFWNNTSDVLVENNWIYQVYDAGLTHQGGQTGGNLWENITYRGNLIEYCSYGIEYFSGQAEDVMQNILIEGNAIRFAGYGWGWVRPNPQKDSLICGWGYTPFTAINFKIRNNIFDVSYNYMIVQFYRTDMDIVFSGNTWYQKKGLVAEWQSSAILECKDQATLEAAVSVIESDSKLIKFLR